MLTIVVDKRKALMERLLSLRLLFANVDTVMRCHAGWVPKTGELQDVIDWGFIIASLTDLAKRNTSFRPVPQVLYGSLCG